jgi:hypothetical protein
VIDRTLDSTFFWYLDQSGCRHCLIPLPLRTVPRAYLMGDSINAKSGRFNDCSNHQYIDEVMTFDRQTKLHQDGNRAWTLNYDGRDRS